MSFARQVEGFFPNLFFHYFPRMIDEVRDLPHPKLAEELSSKTRSPGLSVGLFIQSDEPENSDVPPTHLEGPDKS